MFKMSIEPTTVKPRRVKSSLISNDNNETPMSGLKWREREAIRRRIADLSWQANYTKIQLKRWKDLESDRWQALTELHEKASDELSWLSRKYL